MLRRNPCFSTLRAMPWPIRPIPIMPTDVSAGVSGVTRGIVSRSAAPSASRPARAGRALPRNDPDVPEPHRVGVVLKDERALGNLGALPTRAGAAPQFDVVVNDNAVVAERDAGVARLPPVSGKPRGREVDVVCLPDERRQVHRDIRWTREIERTAPLVVVRGRRPVPVALELVAPA